MAKNKNLIRVIRVIRQIGFAELKVRISPAGFGPTDISLPYLLFCSTSRMSSFRSSRLTFSLLTRAETALR